MDRTLSRSRRSSIAETIRQEILTGELRPGATVRLRDIADRFGVSISPVRDAVLSLEDEGLVSVQTRRGIEVLNLTPTDISDVFNVYAFVSGLFAQRAAELITEEKLKDLQELIDQMDSTQDQAEIEKLNFLFHGIVNRAGPSIYLRSIARMLARNIPHKYFSVIPGRQATAQAGHRELLEALRRRDATLARSIAEQHIRTAGDMVVSHLDEIGYWKAPDSSHDGVSLAG